MPNEEGRDAGADPVSPTERRVRRLIGRKGPYRGPIVAMTRGWVSHDGKLRLFAARFLDFAVLTPEHLVLCSTGFFSRRPRREVLREPLTRLAVLPRGQEPTRTLLIVGDFRRPLVLELRATPDSSEFVRAILDCTRADARHSGPASVGISPQADAPERAVVEKHAVADESIRPS